MACHHVGLFAIAFLLATALANESKPKEEATNEETDEVQPSKRQALYNSIPGAQYAPQQEVPPEFLNYLQQLTEQQAAHLPPAPPHLAQGQPQPQQLLAARVPPQGILQGQPQPGFAQYRVPSGLPGVPRLSPQAEEQRRLQQEYADRPLREQQQRALQQLFQPAPTAYRSLPLYTAQPQQPQPQAVPQQIQQQQYSPEELRALADQQYISYEPQYVEQQVAAVPHPQSQPQQQVQSPKYSYNQIQYSPQPTSHHKVRSQPPHPPQPQPTQLFYSQQPEYYPTEQQTPTHPQLPEQYLIETSKPHQSDERVVSIPRPKAQHGHPSSVYYRPQQLHQAGVPKYVDDNVLRSTTPTPARSSIYVTKSGQDAKHALHYTLGETLQQRFAGGLNQVNLPDTRPNSQHPLSHTELNSLLQAGFQISSSPLEARRSLLSGPTYLKQQQQAKRHSKRVPSPVPLSDEERHELAQQGIRNLYKVESAESQNSPVTYVLALDGNLKNGKHSHRSS